MIELKEISIVEALIVTYYTGWNDWKKDLRVSASLLDPTTHSVALVPGSFNPVDGDDLGKEWVTGPILARYVAVYQREMTILISSFAALGTAYCVVI